MLIGVVGCKSQVTTSDEDLVNVSKAEVRQYLADEEDPAILLDIRSAEDFQAGHIEGAVSAPVTSLRKRDSRLAEVDYIIVYGQNHEDVLAPVAAKKLKAMGYEDVLLYRGGYDQWTGRANTPAEKP